MTVLRVMVGFWVAETVTPGIVATAATVVRLTSASAETVDPGTVVVPATVAVVRFASAVIVGLSIETAAMTVETVISTFPPAATDGVSMNA